MGGHVDGALVRKVREFLESQSQSKKVLDLDEIVEYLRGTTYEYSRRRMRPFRKIVKHAYKIIVEESLANAEEFSSDDSDEEIQEGTVNNNSVSNVMNNTMTGLYNRRKSTPASTSVVPLDSTQNIAGPPVHACGQAAAEEIRTESENSSASENGEDCEDEESSNSDECDSSGESDVQPENDVLPENNVNVENVAGHENGAGDAHSYLQSGILHPNDNIIVHTVGDEEEDQSDEEVANPEHLKNGEVSEDSKSEKSENSGKTEKSGNIEIVIESDKIDQSYAMSEWSSPSVSFAGSVASVSTPIISQSRQNKPANELVLAQSTVYKPLKSSLISVHDGHKSGDRNRSIHSVSKNGKNSKKRWRSNDIVDLTASPSKDLKNSHADNRAKYSYSQPPPTKKFKKTVEPFMSKITFSAVGGMDDTLKALCELLLIIKKPGLIIELGLPPPYGILFYGPSGVGKTLLAHAVAGLLEMKMIEVMATELISGVSGESEERIRDIFEQAKLFAPCVLFIDEIDAIGGNRNNASKDMERRMAGQLINCMDKLRDIRFEYEILVIGATTRPEMLDPALRRVGRFENEFALPIPDCAGRNQILKIICDSLLVVPDVDFAKLAEWTPGFVGADLKALVSSAVTCSVKRKYKTIRLTCPEAYRNLSTPSFKTHEMELAVMGLRVLQSGAVVPMEVVNESSSSIPDEEDLPSLSDLLDWITLPSPPNEMENLALDRILSMEDFKTALKTVKPTAKREGFITVPDVTWDDIGSLQNIRQELELAVLAPVKYPERLKSLGLTAPSGVLLCGPPGCGKTLLAKAVANEAGINFISVKGPELMSMYVGESERAVRTCFQRARNSAPCVIFFDEFDSLCPKRSASSDNGSGTRIVNQLLTEMDGIEDRRGVYILAATNRPDIIDPAILRPGRLDTILYVGLPDINDRIEILNATTKNRTKPMLHDEVCLTELGELTHGFTGADLAGFVRQAAMLALKDTFDMESYSNGHVPIVLRQHFLQAIKMIRPSVTPSDMKVYQKMRLKYAAPRPMEDSSSEEVAEAENANV